MFKRIMIAGVALALFAGSLMGYSEISSRYIYGSLVYHDSRYQHRWIDAIGRDVVKYINTFAGPTSVPVTTTAATDPDEWYIANLTGDAGDTEVLFGESGTGEMVFYTDDTENDGSNIYFDGEAFKLASGYPLYFGVRLKLSDADQSDLMIGLFQSGDADLWGGVTDGVYFESADGTATATFVTEKNTTETSDTSAGTLKESYVILEFYFDGNGTIKAWTDGTLVATSTTNIPDDEALTFAMELLTGEGNDNTVTLDWLRIIQIR